MPSLLAPMTRRYRVANRPFRVVTRTACRSSAPGSARRRSRSCSATGSSGGTASIASWRSARPCPSGSRSTRSTSGGTGEAAGESTIGDREVLDVEAVVARARAEGHRTVVTVGASMGGAAAVRHAALHGGVDAVVAISTPASWDGHRSSAVARMSRMTTTDRGRRIGRAFGVRIARRWGHPESPEEVAGRISPTPILVVHGRDDHYFDEEQGWRLYRAAGEPKRLLLAAPFGHAEDGYSPALAGLIATRLEEVLAAPAE